MLTINHSGIGKLVGINFFQYFLISLLKEVILFIVIIPLISALEGLAF